MDKAQLLKLAAAISEAAGAPWGAALASPHEPASDGSFDGGTAAARVGTTRYQIRHVNGEGEGDGDAALAGSWRVGKNLSLEIRAEAGSEPLGLITLRPRLAEGIRGLNDACRRHRVELAVIASGDREVANQICFRAAVELIDAETVDAIRDRQGKGKVSRRI